MILKPKQSIKLFLPALFILLLPSLMNSSLLFPPTRSIGFPWYMHRTIVPSASSYAEHAILISPDQSTVLCGVYTAFLCASDSYP